MAEVVGRGGRGRGVVGRGVVGREGRGRGVVLRGVVGRGVRTEVLRSADDAHRGGMLPWAVRRELDDDCVLDEVELLGVLPHV